MSSDAIYESLLEHTCDRYTRNQSRNDLGELSNDSWSEAETDIICRMSPISMKESKEMSGEFENIKYYCYILPTQSFIAGDRVLWQGDYYEVMEVKTDSESITRRLALKQL